MSALKYVNRKKIIKEFITLKKMNKNILLENSTKCMKNDVNIKNTLAEIKKKHLYIQYLFLFSNTSVNKHKTHHFWKNRGQKI